MERDQISIQLFAQLNDFPFSNINDWTDQEAEILSKKFCPMTKEEFDEDQVYRRRLQGIFDAPEEQIYQEHTLALSQAVANLPGLGVELLQADGEEDEQVPEDFPLQLEDDCECPVCFLEENLLKLGCEHTICQRCLGKLSPRKCPKCREDIIFFPSI